MDIWDLDKKQIRVSLDQVQHECSFGWSLEGDRFFTVESSNLTVWDVESGRPLLGHTEQGMRLIEGNTLRFSEGSGKLFGWSWNRPPLVWDGTPTSEE